MGYRLLADLVVLSHFAFIGFGLLGGLLLLWHRGFALLHLPAAIWIVLLELYGWHCPLTSLENRLRQLAGNAGYEGGFIEQYLIPVIYPAGLTPTLQMALGGAALGINVIIYGLVIGRQRRG